MPLRKSVEVIICRRPPLLLHTFSTGNPHECRRSRHIESSTAMLKSQNRPGLPSLAHAVGWDLDRRPGLEGCDSKMGGKKRLRSEDPRRRLHWPRQIKRSHHKGNRSIPFGDRGIVSPMRISMRRRRLRVRRRRVQPPRKPIRRQGRGHGFPVCGETDGGHGIHSESPW